MHACRSTLEDPTEPESERRSYPARGLALFTRVYGKDAERVRTNLRGLDAEVADWIVNDAYGKVLSRTAIPVSLRERIAVVLLTAQGLRNQLPGHVKGALNCGATPELVAAFLEAAEPHLPPAEFAFAKETLAKATRELRPPGRA